METTLMDEFILRREVIGAHDKSLESSKKKKRVACEAIAAKVNACSEHKQSETLIQEKMKNIESRVRFILSQMRKA